MKITIKDNTETLAERLRGRLDLASRLRCVEHGEPVVAVNIDGRENGWFDSRWITCCEILERQAMGILKQRC